MLSAMAALPDPAALAAIADRIDGHAAAARSRATQLAAAVASAHWHGLAADAFHAQAHVVIAALRAVAGRLESAAATLRRHADQVATLLADAARLGADGIEGLKDLLTDPGELLGDGATIIGDVTDTVGDMLGAVGL